MSWHSWALVAIVVLYLGVMSDGIRRLSFIETAIGAVQGSAVLVQFLQPKNFTMATVNLFIQRFTLWVLIAGLVVLAVAVDGFGLAAHICDKDLGLKFGGYAAHLTDMKCSGSTRTTMYIVIGIAFLIVVPLQLMILRLFESMREDLIDEESLIEYRPFYAD